MRSGQRGSCGQSIDSGEKQPWSSGAVLEERHVELVGHQRAADMRRELRDVPSIGGRSRAPPPSSATGHSGPTPSAKAE